MHSTVDGPFATLYILVPTFWWKCICILKLCMYSYSYMNIGVELLGHRVCLCRYCKTDFPSDCISLHIHHWCTRVLVAPHPVTWYLPSHPCIEYTFQKASTTEFLFKATKRPRSMYKVGQPLSPTILPWEFSLFCFVLNTLFEKWNLFLVLKTKRA